MPDELFSRFRPVRTAPAQDDSGLEHHSAGGFDRDGEIAAAVDRVPPLPAVAQKLLALVGDQQTTATQLEALIKQDMVIAGRLLRLVNSPFYGLGRTVGSISQAVTLIGFGSLRSLVVAASVANILTLDLGAYGFTDRGLWKNSIATATLARAIAQQTGDNLRAEEYFVAGLMRDIGMLVLGPLLAQRQITLVRPEEGEADILRLERGAFGYDHCRVGDRVGEKWHLPDRLRLCISCHHRIPTSASPDDLHQLAAVRLAERLTYASGIGLGKAHPFDAHIDGVLVSAAGLDGSGFEKLVQQVPAIIATSEMSFT
jgi:HD-like signal output (HDOD) protein